MPPKQNGQKLKNLKPKRSPEMAAVDEQYERDLKQLERLRLTNNNVEQIIQALEYKLQHLMACTGYFQCDFEFETGVRGVAMLMHVAKEAIEVQARQERQAEERRRRQAQERAQVRIEGLEKSHTIKKTRSKSNMV